MSQVLPTIADCCNECCSGCTVSCNDIVALTHQYPYIVVKDIADGKYYKCQLLNGALIVGEEVLPSSIYQAQSGMMQYIVLYDQGDGLYYKAQLQNGNLIVGEQVSIIP